MGRMPFSQSNPFEPSSKRRRVNIRSASSQGGRTGTIDQRLINGSQHQRYSSSFRDDTLSPKNRIPSLQDADSQLDIFDLELLAQESEIGNSHEVQHGFSRETPRQSRFVSAFQQPSAPTQRSRFFDASPSMTTLRPLESIPELTSAPPSSPLIMLNKRKEEPRTEQSQRDRTYDLSQYYTTQSTPQLLSPFQPNSEMSPYDRKNQGPSSPFANLPPSVRGIVLVSKDKLPESYRSLFPFPLFNAIQSKCFQSIYNSNDNLVLSAPTGSGKTVVMELAICRLLKVLKDERFKVVYQAPTKSLCGERFRDWNTKFSALNLKCAELTGDTDHNQLRSVQSSQIIITTPEKWDSMTRKWKDHGRLMQLVKLFLIDEVHILKESRGATLEAVVSRMKNIGSNVRFVALSATVPNSEDIATWLGKDATNQHVPAHREHFGEDFRPVKLQKFVYGYQHNTNDFAFDKVCGSKLPDVIGTHSCQKPIMIFCCTRNSAAATAKDLSRLWGKTNPPCRHWKGPGRRIEVDNEDLQTTISAGVAFHHAGLSAGDRHAIEKGFLDGHINVICCTSTLAVGVNLPCQLVIIKNTVGWQGGGCKEYSDLEMMQMLGRAGRPQFDDSATAVILTRKERVTHYEKLVSGSESLESCLHLNLIDHLNAEIGLENVKDVESATKWLAGTFLSVRLRRNPTYYKLKEGASQEDEDELLRQICEKDIKLLLECDLVDTEHLRSTPFGDAMARYYIRFETMKTILSLKHQATISQILEAIVQAEEFREIRLKAGEKSLYREINRDPGIRFPVKVDIALHTHKISLLLQSELGAIDFPTDDQFQKHKFSFHQDKSLVFNHVNRLIRCVIDCMIVRENSVEVLNSLELARSFGARVWDRSPLQMKQIDQIGVIAVRKLAAAGITDIDTLGSTEAHLIEMTLSKNPPFGIKLLTRLKEFPKLRVAVRIVEKDAKLGNVKVRFHIEVAFMNDKIPVFSQRRPVRIRANRLQDGLDFTLMAELKKPHDYIICHAMCDDIAGTARQAELHPHAPSYLFPAKSREAGAKVRVLKPIMETVQSQDRKQSGIMPKFDDFDGDDLELDDFLTAAQRRDKAKQAAEPKESQVEEFEWMSISNTSSPQRRPETTKPKADDWVADMGLLDDNDRGTIRLPNGNWACNHKCKDKTSCKHFCCRDGLEKPPKPSKSRTLPNDKSPGLNQLTLPAAIKKRDASNDAPRKSQASKSKITKKSSNLSTAKYSIAPIKRISSFQSQLRGKPTSNSSQSIIEKEGHESRARTSSSDIEDFSFADLPPTGLLARSVRRFVKSNSPLVEKTYLKESEDAIINPKSFEIENSDQDLIVPDSTRTIFTAVVAATPMPASQNTQHRRSLKRRSIFDIWSDDVLDSERDIFTNPSFLDSSATTAPFAPSTANTTRNLKRTIHVLEDTHGNAQKQDTQQTSRESTQEPDDPEVEEPVPVEAKAETTSTAEDAPTGWEDIDRLMFEEYGRFINFN
ncbi:sedoheptulose-1-7-bisphosphatase [Penicillium atrosanguineum]|uniref:DNA 3'-5' helicase n=1 Tax=Penicillium atrosanguineum TaxID=1132637 RepID=A0A9W9PQ34_9EURO|nr:sedoheptulose-1-7-bisphosphatase [Penicillium atrosanguineum]KAJ5292397.1 sedoheptulose-1-7-bisphosphatase [Penicillium atrosanguineum]KAJ5303579.1 hypothetical protein N7476_010378 [Penicillium atrosanguineum]